MLRLANINAEIDSHDIGVNCQFKGISAQNTQPTGSIIEDAIISPGMSNAQLVSTFDQYMTAATIPIVDEQNPPITQHINILILDILDSITTIYT